MDTYNETNNLNRTFAYSIVYENPYWQRAYFPFVAVGIFLNVLSFLVWQAEAKKSTTTLLFMYLAITDSTHLVIKGSMKSKDLYYLIGKVSFFVLDIVAELGLVISVHTTTLIAINRWFAIWKPLHVRDVMTRRRVIVMCVVTSFWSAILVATFYSCEIIAEYEPDYVFETSVTYAALVIVSLLLARIVPIVVLLVCSISIVWMMVRHRRKIEKFSDGATQSRQSTAATQAAEATIQSTTTSAQSAEAASQSSAAPRQSTAATQSAEATIQSTTTSAQSAEAVTQSIAADAQSTAATQSAQAVKQAAAQSAEAGTQSTAASAQSAQAAPQSTAETAQAAPQSTAETAQAAAQSKADARQRKLTLAVLCIAGVTFIAFPLGVSLIITSRFAAEDYDCDYLCYVAMDIYNIVTAINCGINFVFYMAFCTRFRELLKQRVSACLCCVRCKPRHNNPGMAIDP